MIREAVILAAGLGARLGAADGRPKGFTDVGGRSLVERSIDKLLAFGIERIVIGTGYGAAHYEALAAVRPQLVCVHSPDYAATSSMRTLYQLRAAVKGDFLLLESDILYARDGLAALAGAPHANLVLASDFTASGDEVYIETRKDGRLVNMSKKREALGSVDAELVGITRLSRALLTALCAVAAARFPAEPRLDYEACLVAAAAQGADIRVLRLDGFPWCEVDTPDHLRRARERVLPRVLERERHETA
jgi:2-aminoethylphosphonate-pyruvate transaminase